MKYILDKYIYIYLIYIIYKIYMNIKSIKILTTFALGSCNLAINLIKHGAQKHIIGINKIANIHGKHICI